MEFVVFIAGEVETPITIDPSVWIFDERKVDLDTYFLNNAVEIEDEETKYTKRMSAQWDKELTEGSEPPKPEDSNKILYKKEVLLNGSFAMPFEPFLNNSKPKGNAQKIIIETANESVTIPLAKGKELLLGFSKKGKPLREDGPIHVYFHDGSNQDNPITDVKKFIIC
jgi:hypothetical protein